MTHFIGAVLVPAEVHVDFVRTPTKYPSLYGKDALETDPTPTLEEYLKVALDKFDENKEVERWVSKEDTITEARLDIMKYSEGLYAEFLADPVKYAERVTNPEHLLYLREEFPKKLTWTDEEVYKDAIKYEEEEDIREDGAVRHTYNPDSKWDWYSIGGRWEGVYRDRQGETVGEFVTAMEQALVDMQDPENMKELAEVEAYIQTVKDQFAAQRDAVGVFAKANPEAVTGTYEQNVALATGTTLEKVLTWQDVDKAEAKRLDCKGYMPWWFPYNVVVPKQIEKIDGNEARYNEDGSPEMTTEYEWLTRGSVGWFGMTSDDLTKDQWVEALIEEMKKHDPAARMVYIDFHI